MVEESPTCELSPEALADALAAYRGGTFNHGYMNCGRGSATIHPVVGVMDHQTALAVVAGTPRPWRHPFDRHIPAVLLREPGSSPGENSVRVLTDGMMVGYLVPGEVSVATSGLLDELAVTRQLLVAAALIVGGGERKSIGVRLQVRPGAATRWAAGTKPADIAGWPPPRPRAGPRTDTRPPE